MNTYYPEYLGFDNQQSFDDLPNAGEDGSSAVFYNNLNYTNNYVIESPVPSKVLQSSELVNSAEFTHMRYTACTCDPDDFIQQNYNLRQNLLSRTTEIFIVVTMYNENHILFNRTYQSLIKNISYLCSRSKSKVWGTDAWQKVVVCIVADGLDNVSKYVLDILGMMGVYQECLLQQHTGNRDIVAHLFELTSQLYVTEDCKLRSMKNCHPPVQVLLCLKAQNKKKINSHRWFFNAFAPLLNPYICVLIDVGTVPTRSSIYYLWKAFDKNPNVAGACGEICADLGKCSSKLVNPLVAAQNFEYKMSNILDKPLESVFGYITVLPGAFSAYLYKALTSRFSDDSPLSVYFKGEHMHSTDSNNGIFQANMYLAEDRILCFELVARKHHSYVLQYVKSAKASTDVPESLSELIAQRRRWLNGSFFAMTYSIFRFHRILKTSHSFFRLSLLSIELFYQLFSQVLSWFSLANFYLAFHFMSIKLTDPKQNDPFFGVGQFLCDSVKVIYVLSLVVVIILSLGNKPQSSQWVYAICALFFSLIMVLLLCIFAFSITEKMTTLDFSKGFAVLSDSYTRDIILSTTTTLGLYFLSSLIYGQPWHMFSSFLQYMLWIPVTVNILTVYAFCNIHDVSWGTKGDSMATVASDHRTSYQHFKPKDGSPTRFTHGSNRYAVDTGFEKCRQSITAARFSKFRPEPKTTCRDDKNKLFRTNLVILWISSNFFLAITLSSSWYSNYIHTVDKLGSFNPYLTFIFWITCGVTFFRFFVSLIYVLNHYFIGL